MSLRKQTPSDFLKQIIGRPVVVKLNSGVDYRGVLACLDGYMNIALEQTEEYVNGQLKNKYGDAFIRGNNGNSPSLYSYIASTIGLCVYNQITSRFSG
ncbi:hypothetical protein Celaphus_00000539 [Cervus elaphus hippelaphus]|uniref:U6 snRNA-associated Sm-like protein LSm6 n=1 Tax=Cervus elaphus hippelaphus TaxID=46360 RepID=A0A212D6X7_CEREH|nr:hypothetical protein Celaphus_00000539 [Cervus elaphus hippelaphus]